MSTQQESKADQIARVQGNLPLPEQPPVASDWNSADARNLNVGSGGRESDISSRFDAATSGLREPATKESGVRAEDGVDLGGKGEVGKSE